MSKRQILLLSSSKLAGYEFLEHAKDQIENVLKPKQVKTVLFVPYALKNHDNYTKTVSDALTKWGYKVEGIHTHKDPIEAINKSEAIFIGGGNTFVLIKTLIEKNLIDPIRKRVLVENIPYIGSSAGTNVATKSIHTTNDMPVVYPPSFDGLKLVPFNINPHYLETDPNTKHRGETRDERIGEFVDYHKIPVLGLREGTAVFVDGEKTSLVGPFPAKLFKGTGETEELPPGSDLTFLC